MFWITVLIIGWLSYILVGILCCCLTYWLTNLFLFLLVDIFCSSVLYTGWYILLLCRFYWLTHFSSLSYILVDIFCFSVLYRPLKQNSQECLSAAVFVLFWGCSVNLYPKVLRFASNLSSSDGSHVALLFTKEEQEKVGSWRTWYFRYTCKLCSWRHWYGHKTPAFTVVFSWLLNIGV